MGVEVLERPDVTRVLERDDLNREARNLIREFKSRIGLSDLILSGDLEDPVKYSFSPTSGERIEAYFKEGDFLRVLRQKGDRISDARASLVGEEGDGPYISRETYKQLVDGELRLAAFPEENNSAAVDAFSDDIKAIPQRSRMRSKE